MNQQEIRDYNGQQYTVSEGAALIKELNARTISEQEGYNSIDALATAVIDLKNNTSLSINFFGCKGDAIQLSDFNVTGKNLNSPTAVFKSDDVGKIVSIANAGVGLEHLVTTIATFIDVNNVTLTDAADVDVVNQLGSYGTDNLGPLNNAIAAAKLSKKKLIAPAGIYLIGDVDSNGETQVKCDFNTEDDTFYFEGAGKGLTVFRELDGKTQRLGRYTKIFNMFLKHQVNVGEITLKGFTIDKNARSITKELPDNEWKYEQSYGLGFIGSSSTWATSCKGITVEDVEVFDKIGAGIACAVKSVFDKVSISNITQSTPSYRTSDEGLTRLADWDANTNTPDILTDTSGNTIGEFHKVTVAGIQNGISYDVDDTVRFNGTDWLRVRPGRLTNQNNILIGERGCLETTVFSKNINIDNINLNFVQIEPTAAQLTTRDKQRIFNITNSYARVLQFTENKLSDLRYSIMNINNVTSRKFTNLNGVLQATNCDLIIAGKNTSIDGLFSNCTIRLPYDSDSNSIDSVACTYYSTIGLATRITFDSCNFIIDNDDIAILPTGYAIKDSGTTNDLSLSKVVIRRCKFDKRLYGSVSAYARAEFLIENNELAGKNIAVRCGAYSGGVSKVVLRNNDYSRVDIAGGARAIKIQDSNLIWEVQIHERLLDNDFNMTWGGTLNHIENGGITAYPTILLDDIANRNQQYVKGTIVEITNPAAGTYSKYICTAKGNKLASSWKGMALVEV